jgi:hypothetical protein
VPEALTGFASVPAVGRALAGWIARRAQLDGPLDRGVRVQVRFEGDGLTAAVTVLQSLDRARLLTPWRVPDLLAMPEHLMALRVVDQLDRARQDLLWAVFGGPRRWPPRPLRPAGPDPSEP